MPEEPPDTNKTWTKKVPIDNTARPMSPASCARKSFVFMSLLLAAPTFVPAQVSVVAQGSEYSMSGSIAGDQLRPAVAFGSGGGFVVMEDNGADPSGLGIRARRLNAELSPVGEPFLVNQTLGGDQQHARICLLGDGSGFVVWESGRPGAQNVYARLVNAGGAFTTDEILVNRAAFKGYNLYTTNWVLIRNNKAHAARQKIREIINNHQEFNSNPTPVALSDGTVVVVYSSSRKESVKKGYDLVEEVRWDEKKQIHITNRKRVRVDREFDYMQDVYFQRFSATGQKLGDETVANGKRQFNQRGGSIAALSSGGFVVCWVSEVPGVEGRIDTRVSARGGGRIDVFARFFGADGQPAGTEFRVNTNTLPCGTPVVTARNGGGFTVAWIERENVRSNGMDIWVRSFDQIATPAGMPIRANTHVFGDQFAPAIATVGAQQILVWSSMGQDGSWEGVYGQLFQDGAVAGAEFRVNTTTHLRQINPAVTASGKAAAVVWASYGFESGFNVLSQLYKAP